jgi:hypothetical protein
MLGHKKPIGRWIVVMLWCFSSGMALAQTADEALLAAQLNFQRAKASIDEADKKLQLATQAHTLAEQRLLDAQRMLQQASQDLQQAQLGRQTADTDLLEATERLNQAWRRKQAE